MKSETSVVIPGNTKRISSTADKIPEVFTTSITMKARLDPEKLLNAFGKYGKYQVVVVTLLEDFITNQFN